MSCPLDQHVGLADGVGLGVQLLAIHDEPGVGIEAGEVLAGDAQHAAGAGGGIVEAAHHAGLREGIVVLDEEEIHHEPDDLARGEVLPGGLIGKLGELADEFLEDRAHLRIADRGWVQVDVGELFCDEIEQPDLASRSIWVWKSKLSKMSRTSDENACTYARRFSPM